MTSICRTCRTVRQTPAPWDTPSQLLTYIVPGHSVTDSERKVGGRPSVSDASDMSDKAEAHRDYQHNHVEDGNNSAVLPHCITHRTKET